MACTMSHEYESSLLICSFFKTLKSSLCKSCTCYLFCYSLLVFVYDCCISANFSKKWFSHLNCLKGISVLVNGFYKLIILCTMHKMCRLDHKIFYAICNCSFKGLIHVINSFAISCLDVVDNDLSCKCSSY